LVVAAASLAALVVVPAPPVGAAERASPRQAAAFVTDPASLVNPFIGTTNSADDFPGADVPLGMVQWSPDTPSRPDGGGGARQVPGRLAERHCQRHRHRSVRVQRQRRPDTGAAATSGTKMELYTCNGTVSQDWRATTSGQLINLNSGRCLDDPSSSTTPGTQVRLWGCDNTATQDWHRPA
jgi:putative alpha-1,2-mannosidase